MEYSTISGVSYKTRKVMHGYMLSVGEGGGRGGSAPSLTLLNQNKHPFNKYWISNNTLQATQLNI
jgi:hypothetical protein